MDGDTKRGCKVRISIKRLTALLVIIVGCEKYVPPPIVCEKMPLAWCVNACIFQHERATDEPLDAAPMISLCREVVGTNCYALRRSYLVWDDDYKCKDAK